MRKVTPFAAVAALARMLAVAAQAPAISRGVPDGESHPMVAALGGTTPEGVFRYCGAVLVSETVLVTAAHCVAPGARPPGVELRVDFGNNATLNDPGWFGPVAEVASPQFLAEPRAGEIGFGRSSDVGVVLLAPGQSGGRPFAQLPTRDLLGAMDSQHGLAGTLFDLVGYGCHANGSSGGPHRAECGTERQTASAPFQALRPNWLVLNINVNATGEGGGCVHDSGTPQFLHDTTRVVSLTTGGDHLCRATQFNSRLDTDAAREFLTQYVALP